MDKFVVGDEVWDIDYGPGVVKQVSEETFGVYFPGMGRRWYFSSDEHYGKTNKNGVRHVYYSEPQIVGEVTRPFKPTLKPGTMVLCIDSYGKHHFIVVDKETKDAVVNTAGWVLRKEDCQFFSAESLF